MRPCITDFMWAMLPSSTATASDVSTCTALRECQRCSYSWDILSICCWCCTCNSCISCVCRLSLCCACSARFLPCSCIRFRMVATCSLSCCCLAALLVVGGSMLLVYSWHQCYGLHRLQCSSQDRSDSYCCRASKTGIRHIDWETHTYTEIDTSQGLLYSPTIVRGDMGWLAQRHN